MTAALTFITITYDRTLVDEVLTTGRFFDARTRRAYEHCMVTPVTAPLEPQQQQWAIRGAETSCLDLGG